MKYKLLFLAVLLLNTLPSVAQIGPAGINSNNIIWLDASDLGSFTTGSTWADKSGNNFDAVHGTGTAPTLGAINGANALVFSGLASEVLSIADDDATTDLLDNSPEFSVMVVFETGGANDQRAIISKRLSSGARSWALFYNNGFDMYGYANNVTVGTNNGGTGNVAAANNPYVSTMTVNASQTELFVNGTSVATAAGVAIPDRTEDILIGMFNAGDTRYFDGKIAEIIVYRSSLNGAERTIIENYLQEKYSISISNDVFVSAGAGYDTDLRGIGTSDGTVKKTTSGFSDALQIEEASNGLDVAGEYYMIAHDGAVSHTSDVITTDFTDPEITDRWNKDYYIERTGISDAKLRFDFGDAGYTIGSASDYVLIYRSGTSGNYTRIAATNYSIENGDQLVVTVPGANLSTGYYTVARGNPITSRTWYVLTNGDWDDPNTWTLDAGTAPFINNPGNETPGIYDNIVIRNGKIVNILTDNKTVLGATVTGTINVGTTTGHNFNVIEGTGVISIEGNAGVDNFPAGTTTTPNGFGNALNGGTLLVKGTTGFTFDQNRTEGTATAFNKVRIETTDATDVVAIGADLLINGTLTVRNGTLQFGDGTATARELEVRGDIRVENNGSTRDGRITTAVNPTGAVIRHEFNIYGDFLNQGSMSFTSRTAAGFTDVTNANEAYYTTEAQDGFVDFNLLSPDENQTVDINGTSNFYRIEVNKGTDATYIATLQADDPSNFNLLGPANDNLDDDIVNTDQLDGNNNALGLITGTLRIGTNINVPVLNRNTNYCIGQNGRLWIDGGTVTKNAATAIVPYGVLEVSEGTLTATGNSGVTLRINGLFKVSGGTVNTNNIRTSIQGTQSLGGYEQTGGTVLVDGTLGAGNARADYYVMSLTYTGNVFLMSGGTLTVRNPNGTGGIFINSDPGNVSVTGGTVRMESNNANDFIITSRAEFYDVQMFKTAGTGNFILQGGTSGSGADATTLAGQPLKVLGDLSILGNDTDVNYEDVKLYATTSNTEANDVYIGGSFIIEEGGQYVACFPDFTTDPTADNYEGSSDQPTNVNTTYFNQTIATQSIEEISWGNNDYFDYDGLDEGNPTGLPDQDENVLEIGNVVLERTSGYELRLTSPGPGGAGPTGADRRPNSRITLDINGNVSILSGTFDQGRLTVRMWGDVTNYDRFGTYFDASSSYPTASGTPGNAQVRFREDGNITLDTRDGAIFGNTRFNSGVSGANQPLTLTSDVVIERLQMLRGYIYLRNHNLTVEEMYDLDNDRNILDGDARAMFLNNNVNSVLDTRDETRHNNGGTRPGEVFFITDGKASDGGLTLKVTGNTADNASEDRVSRRDNLGPITFPVGFVLNNTNVPIVNNTPLYFRPAQVEVSNFVDEGYITIRPVSGELQTADFAAGEILQNYWKVSHSGFATPPTVAYRFYYYNQNTVAGVDLPAGSTADFDINNYVPGKVLDDGDFQRSYESDPDLTTAGSGEEDLDGVFADATNPNIRMIVFNGFNTGTAGDGDFEPTPGFTLENASYTAGQSVVFEGAPRKLYARRNGQWHDPSTWSLTPGGAALTLVSELPAPGDIVILGADASNDNHLVAIDPGNANFATINVARTVILRYASGESSLLTFGDSEAQRVLHNFGVVTNQDPDKSDPTSSISQSSKLKFVGPGLPQGDFGDFTSAPNTLWTYARQFPGVTEAIPRMGGGNVASVNFDGYTISNAITEYPVLQFDASGTTIPGTNQYITLPDVDIVVNGSVRHFIGSNAVRFNTSATGGNVTVRGDFQYNTANCSWLFPAAGGAKTLTVEGDIDFNNNNNTSISVENAASAVVHTLQLGGSVIDNNSGSTINLYNSDANTKGNLELIGTGNEQLPDFNTATAFNKIIMNKGNSKTNTFTILDDITMSDVTVSGEQPIEVLNGVLILDNAGIDVTLTDATAGDFYLPNTLSSEATSGSGGLEIAAGTLRMEGNNTGMILDGCLTISGGTLDMASSGDNNYIGYTSSGNSSITVTDGVLDVGGQIRRGLTSVTGVLDYTQSNGAVRVGVNAAPNATRGVFEVLNAGSSFIHTGGSFSIVRQNGSGTVASLIMQPDTYDFSGSIITIGDADTPGSGQNSIGINATVPLNTLRITGNGSLTAKTYINALTVSNLTIDANGTYDANGLNLTMADAFTNNGTFVSSGDAFNDQTTFFNKAGTQNISGSGTTTFYNLNHTAVGGTLTLGKDITISNDLNVLQASSTFNTATFAANIKGDAILQGNHVSTATVNPASAPGLVFNGTELQNFERLSAGISNVGRITINNSNGVAIAPEDHSFIVDHSVVLESGVFNIGGNLLTLDTDAVIEDELGNETVNDFNTNNMISVNTSQIDRGVRKVYPDGYSGTFVYPVGLNFYTPVEVVATNVTGVPANTGFITIKPIDQVTQGINEDDDTDGTDCPSSTSPISTDYTDADNVLQYFWLLKSSNIGGFDGRFRMHYGSNSLVSVNNSDGLGVANYAPARLLNNESLWDKDKSETLFDETNRIITYQDGGSNYSGLTSFTMQGRYTAGITRDNSDNELCGNTGAIPTLVPQYITAGSQGSVGFDGVKAGQAAFDPSSANGTLPPPKNGDGTPAFSPDLIVSSGDNLILDLNAQTFRKITLQANSTLIVPDGVIVDLGTVVSNGGQLVLQKGTGATADPSFPAGDFDEYFPTVDGSGNCTGGQGGLIYENADAGNDPMSVLPSLATVYELTLRGPGEKVLANNSTVCNDLLLTDGEFDMGTTAQELIVKGDITKTGTATFEDVNGGKIILNGPNLQLVTGNFSGSDMLNDLEVDNASNVTIGASSNVEVGGTLTFTNGLINTSASDRLIIDQTGSMTNYSASRYVNGPLVRERSSTAASDFDVFPVGKDGRYGIFELNNITFGTPAVEEFTVEYFNASSGSDASVIAQGGSVTGPFSSSILEKTSETEYWTVDVPSTNNPTSNVRLTWDSQSDVQANISNLYVVYWKINPGDTQWNLLSSSNRTGSVTNGTIIGSGLSYSTNVVTFASSDATITPLPVELIDFKARPFGQNQVELKWETSLEINNEYFLIEYSTDGENFVSVGQVQGHGTSDIGHKYRFVHKEARDGFNYYRLKQVDTDGSYTYSRVEQVTLSIEPNALPQPMVAVFPNPIRTGEELKVEAVDLKPSQQYELKMVDITGRSIALVVDKTDRLGQLSTSIPVNAGLESGMYIIRLTDGTNLFTRKISIIR